MSGRGTWAWFAGAAALGLCATWAFWPLPNLPTRTVLAPTTESPHAKPVTVAALDREAFAAPIWVAPSAPAAPPAPAPPPPPMRLQLIAIVRDDAGFKASLYDPDSDALLLVGAGDAAGGRTVERVSATSVEFKESGRARTLSLRAEGGRP